ncbi:hypothetical protein D3C77_578300 [compost metagenome]
MFKGIEVRAFEHRLVSVVAQILELISQDRCTGARGIRNHVLHEDERRVGSRDDHQRRDDQVTYKRMLFRHSGAASSSPANTRPRAGQAGLNSILFRDKTCGCVIESELLHRGRDGDRSR